MENNEKFSPYLGPVSAYGCPPVENEWAEQRSAIIKSKFKWWEKFLNNRRKKK
jgi:hypothetical protein